MPHRSTSCFPAPPNSSRNQLQRRASTHGYTMWYRHQRIFVRTQRGLVGWLLKGLFVRSIAGAHPEGTEVHPEFGALPVLACWWTHCSCSSKTQPVLEPFNWQSCDMGCAGPEARAVQGNPASINLPHLLTPSSQLPWQCNNQSPPGTANQRRLELSSRESTAKPQLSRKSSI